MERVGAAKLRGLCRAGNDVFVEVFGVANAVKDVVVSLHVYVVNVAGGEENVEGHEEVEAGAHGALLCLELGEGVGSESVVLLGGVLVEAFGVLSKDLGVGPVGVVVVGNVVLGAHHLAGALVGRPRPLGGAPLGVPPVADGRGNDHNPQDEAQDGRQPQQVHQALVPTPHPVRQVAPAHGTSLITLGPRRRHFLRGGQRVVVLILILIISMNAILFVRHVRPLLRKLGIFQDTANAAHDLTIIISLTVVDS
eukprot:scaffold35278_cov54-Attheya_sp.AAC.1